MQSSVSPKKLLNVFREEKLLVSLKGSQNSELYCMSHLGRHKYVNANTKYEIFMKLLLLLLLLSLLLLLLLLTSSLLSHNLYYTMLLHYIILYCIIYMLLSLLFLILLLLLLLLLLVLLVGIKNTSTTVQVFRKMQIKGNP